MFNSEYIPDILERGEARCEAWAAESLRGDEFTCSCGNACKLRDAQTTSADPYAIPICPTCFESWYRGETEQPQGSDK